MRMTCVDEEITALCITDVRLCNIKQDLIIISELQIFFLFCVGL